MASCWLGKVLPFVLTTLLLTSCGSDAKSSQQSQSQNGNYKDTKTMILDILKTEEGEQALVTASQKAAAKDNSQLKLLSAGDSQHIQLAVKDVLTDTSNNKFLQSVITDPKFAGEFAKAVQTEMKQMQKDLMKDPDYQQSLVSTMNNSDFEKMLLNTLKSTQYRQQTKTVIQESMQSPMFRLDLMNVMKKVLEEESQPSQKQQGQGGGGQSKQGGGGSGGKSGGGGGGGGG